MVSYLIGQGLQAGIRDQEIQFYRVGPDGIVSRVDVHGIVFPTRGEHRISFGSDGLAAPYTISFPELSPFCLACAFPGTSGTLSRSAPSTCWCAGWRRRGWRSGTCRT